MKKRASLLVLTLFAVVCCYYQYPNMRDQYRPLDMSILNVGMTEDDVRSAIGRPADVIGSKIYEDGHVMRVLQYMEIEFGWGSYDPVRKNYYLYFADGELVQWGRPGDWRDQANEIYEFRFRPSQGEIP